MHTPEQKRKIAQFMQNRRRQLKALEPRRYPKTFINTKIYIDDYNQLNRDSYRKTITLEYSF
jgi:hypothetical protein